MTEFSCCVRVRLFQTTSEIAYSIVRRRDGGGGGDGGVLKVPRAMSLNALKYIYLRADVNQDGRMSAKEALAALRVLHVISLEHDDAAGLRLVKRVFELDDESHSPGLTFDDFCHAYATLRSEIATGNGKALMAMSSSKLVSSHTLFDCDAFDEKTNICAVRYGREASGTWVLETSRIRRKSQADALASQMEADAEAHTAGSARVFWWLNVSSPKDARVLDALQSLAHIPAASLASAYSTAPAGLDVYNIDGSTKRFAACLLHAPYLVNVPFRFGPPRIIFGIGKRFGCWGGSARKAHFALESRSTKNPIVAAWGAFWMMLCGRQPGAVRLIRASAAHSATFIRREDAVHAVARAVDIAALASFDSLQAATPYSTVREPVSVRVVASDVEGDTTPASPAAVRFVSAGFATSTSVDGPFPFPQPRGLPSSILGDAQAVLRRHEFSPSLLLATDESSPDEHSTVHIVSKSALRVAPPTFRAPAIAAFASRTTLLTLSDARAVQAGGANDPAGAPPADIAEILIGGVRARLSAVVMAQGTATRESDSRIVDGPGALLGALLETIVTDFGAGGALTALEEWAEILSACVAESATSTVSAHVRVLGKRVDEFEAMIVGIADVLAAAVEVHAVKHGERETAAAEGDRPADAGDSPKKRMTVAARSLVPLSVDHASMLGAGKDVADLFFDESMGLSDSSLVRTQKLFDEVRARCKALQGNVVDLGEAYKTLLDEQRNFMSTALTLFTSMTWPITFLTGYWG